MFGIEGLGGEILLLLIVAALCAGWIDAVVGGGGLLQLPALLLVPGMSPVQALATNKLASIFGTATSATTFYRRAKPDLRTAIPMAVVALLGSFGGAFIATVLPASAFKPIIVLALIAVVIFTALRPAMGASTALTRTGRRHYVTASIMGGVIGFYDGMIGPGTGTFLVITLVAMIGYDFIQASAKAKIVNFATNLGALLLFIPTGAVVWLLGLVLGVANIIGAYLGARMALAKGTGFIRWVFLSVVCVLIIKLAVDVWHENIEPLLQ